MEKKLNVILDIDETFVQFVGAQDWVALKKEEQDKYQTFKTSRGDVFILRPGFDEFFERLFAICKTVNLWTWSDREYAEGLARMIASRNPVWKVANIWADEDVDASIELHGHNKDLNYIWYRVKAPGFQPCNTILVDDLPGNTNNSSNRKNGIQIKPFDVLGEKLGKKDRAPGKIRSGHYTDLSKDDTLLKVADVIENAAKKSDFCKDGDLPFPFTEHQKVNVGGGRRKKTRRHAKKRMTRRRR